MNDPSNPNIVSDYTFGNTHVSILQVGEHYVYLLSNETKQFGYSPEAVEKLINLLRRSDKPKWVIIALPENLRSMANTMELVIRPIQQIAEHPKVQYVLAILSNDMIDQHLVNGMILIGVKIHKVDSIDEALEIITTGSLPQLE